MPEHQRYPNSPPIDTQEPTADSLIDVLEGRPLVRQPNYTDTELCVRCDEKNDVRHLYDIPQKPPELLDGHRVRLFAVYRPDLEPPQGWVVTAALHLDHPTKPEGEVAAPGAAQAQVTARMDETGWTYEQPALDTDHTVEDRCVLRDVEIEWFSSLGEGEEREPIREPDEHGAIELRPTDPRPNWPDEENEWREQVMRENDDWDDDIPTAHLSL